MAKLEILYISGKRYKWYLKVTILNIHHLTQPYKANGYCIFMDTMHISRPTQRLSCPPLIFSPKRLLYLPTSQTSKRHTHTLDPKRRCSYDYYIIQLCFTSILVKQLLLKLTFRLIIVNYEYIMRLNYIRICNFCLLSFAKNIKSDEFIIFSEENKVQESELIKESKLIEKSRIN